MNNTKRLTRNDTKQQYILPYHQKKKLMRQLHEQTHNEYTYISNDESENDDIPDNETTIIAVVIEYE
jgi:hypothetical protein